MTQSSAVGVIDSFAHDSCELHVIALLIGWMRSSLYFGVVSTWYCHNVYLDLHLPILDHLTGEYKKIVGTTQTHKIL